MFTFIYNNVIIYIEMEERIMKITWLQKFDNQHKDSVWYGGDIVSIEFGRYTIIIGAFGDIRACINGDYYCDKNNGGMFKEYLNEQHIYNDEDLSKAEQEGKIEFGNNNWFEAVIWDNKAKDYVESYDTVIDELDENDNFAWIKPWIKNLVS